MSVTPPTRESRDVHIKVPAKADYLVLARLALSAICRLAPLEHNEVADLKLAVTEAASRFIADDGDGEIEFFFRLSDSRLELELRGAGASSDEGEQELSRAIVEATVDEVELGAERALLVKRIPSG